MKLILVLLIALVGVQSMTLMEKYPINFTQKRSIMTLLTQVESQIKAGGPLDAITTMLQDFQTTIIQEQLNHDSLWAEQQEQCNEEIEFRNTEISNAVAALQEATETLDGCTAQRVRASGDLQITKKQLSENRSFLVQVEDTRKRQAYAFETYTTSFNLSSRLVDEALIILEEIQAGESSFLQLSNHMNTMLKQSIKVKKAHLMTGVMAALVQLSNRDIQADDELLSRVKTLFLNFRARLEAGLAEAVAAEDVAIEEYNAEKQRLTSTIEGLVAQQAGLEAELKELEKCIIVQSGIVSSATTKRDRNQRLLDDTTHLCVSVKEEYFTASEARKEELELLRVIRERVEARFAQMSEGVQSRGKQDNFEYDAQNDYEREHFVPSNRR